MDDLDVKKGSIVLTSDLNNTNKQNNESDKKGCC